MKFIAMKVVTTFLCLPVFIYLGLEYDALWERLAGEE